MRWAIASSKLLKPTYTVLSNAHHRRELMSATRKVALFLNSYVCNLEGATLQLIIFFDAVFEII